MECEIWEYPFRIRLFRIEADKTGLVHRGLQMAIPGQQRQLGLRRVPCAAKNKSEDEGEDDDTPKGFSASSITKDLQDLVTSTFDGDLEEADFDITQVTKVSKDDDWMDWEGGKPEGDWEGGDIPPIVPAVFGDKRFLPPPPPPPLLSI